jgi:tRNA 2-thiouridine synthesizing protein A
LAALSGSRYTPSRITAAPSDSSVRSTRMRAAGSSVGSCAMVRSQPLKVEATACGADSSMRHNNFMNYDKELDARGLNCPLPILRTKKALTHLSSGQVLKVLATDPGAVKDFQTFSRQTGHELVSHGEANKEFTFFMRKK